MTTFIGWKPEHEGQFVPHAVLNKGPEFFEKVFSARFYHGSDDLDYYVASLARLGDGLVFGLIAHRGDPPHTVKVALQSKPDEVVDIPKVSQAINSIVSGLGLSPDDLLWQRRDTPDA